MKSANSSLERHIFPRIFLAAEELVALLESKNFWAELTQAALAQAQASHINQRRDNGGPYLEQHIYPVVRDLVENLPTPKLTPEMIAAALLHDVLEDDPKVNISEFKTKFGAKLTNIVLTVTKPQLENSSELTQAEKFEINKKMLSGNLISGLP